MSKHAFVAALLFLCLAPAARAVDGVLEINQTCAVNTGCFSGDTVGFPVTIDGSAGGSYRLTSNLVVPNENADAIFVSTSSLTIDLNGFEIVRSGCEGAEDNCTPVSGTGSGVEAVGPLNRGISIRNGSITGMGRYGVLLGNQAEVQGLRVRWNRVRGINVGLGSTVSGNSVYENGNDGIFADSGSSVSGNTAYKNGEDGIFASFGSVISANTAYQNIANGIVANSGATVERNSVRENGGYGLELGSAAAYRENVITGNIGGAVNGGVNLGDNSCNGNPTCP